MLKLSAYKKTVKFQPNKKTATFQPHIKRQYLCLIWRRVKQQRICSFLACSFLPFSHKSHTACALRNNARCWCASLINDRVAWLLAQLYGWRVGWLILWVIALPDFGDLDPYISHMQAEKSMAWFRSCVVVIDVLVGCFVDVLLMRIVIKWNEWCFRSLFCTVRLYWTDDNLD